MSGCSFPAATSSEISRTSFGTEQVHLPQILAAPATDISLPHPESARAKSPRSCRSQLIPVLQSDPGDAPAPCSFTLSLWPVAVNVANVAGGPVLHRRFEPPCSRPRHGDKLTGQLDRCFIRLLAPDRRHLVGKTNDPPSACAPARTRGFVERFDEDQLCGLALHLAEPDPGGHARGRSLQSHRRRNPDLASFQAQNSCRLTPSHDPASSTR